MCDGPTTLETIPEFSARVKMRPGTVYDLIRRRGWPAYRIGRSVRVDPAELLVLLREEGER